jgi:hypothetical protein
MTEHSTRRCKTKLYRNFPSAIFAGLMLMGLAACEKGPAEKAGESIDDAASDVADKTADAVDAAKDKMDQ